MPNSLPTLPTISQQSILDLFDRLLPQHYLGPLKEPGPGYEYLQAVAAMIARVSTAISHVGTGSYILSATDGAYATVDVEISRPNNAYGAVTLSAGSLVGTEDGYLYSTQTDAVLGLGTGPITVQAKATARGWLWNQWGPFTTASGELVEGPINQLVKPIVAAPTYFDPTLVVRQVGPATGGISPMLDGLGLDRGLARIIGESQGQYQNRLWMLPETVTPNAIQRILDYVIGKAAKDAGKTYAFREGWDPRMMTAYDFPANITLTDPYDNTQTFNANVFVYDYAPADALSNRYPLPRGNFVVALPNITGMEATYAGLADNLEQARPAGISVGYILTP